MYKVIRRYGFDLEARNDFLLAVLHDDTVLDLFGDILGGYKAVLPVLIFSMALRSRWSECSWVMRIKSACGSCV